MKLYQSILSIIPEGLAVINSDKKLIYANPTLKKILQTNSKLDILQTLMNLGNNDKINQNQSKFSNNNNNNNNKNNIYVQTNEKQYEKSKFNNLQKKQSDKTNNNESSGEIQNNDINKDIIIDNIENNLDQNIKIQKLDHSDISINFEEKNNIINEGATLKVPQINNQYQQYQTRKSKINSFISQCSIDNRKYSTLENQPINDKSKLNIAKSLTSINNLSKNDFLENNQEDFKFNHQTIDDDANKSNLNIKIENNNSQLPNHYNSNSQLRISPSNKQNQKINLNSKIRDPRIDYSQKTRGYKRDSIKNQMSLNNFQYFGSENSEILSYQGFGFLLGEEDMTSPKVNSGKRLSENFSIKSCVDNNSILSFTQQQQQKRKSLQMNNCTLQNLKNRNQKRSILLSKPLEELAECQQLSQESDSNKDNPSVNDFSDISNNKKQSKQKNVQIVYNNNNSNNNNNISNNNNNNSNNNNNNSSSDCQNNQEKLSQNNIPDNENNIPDNENNSSNKVQQVSSYMSILSNFNITQKNYQDKFSNFQLKLKSGNYLRKTKIASTQIIQKKTDVSDILNNLFTKNEDNNQNNCYQTKHLVEQINSQEEQKDTATFRKQQTTQSNKDSARKYDRDPNKKQSFISHLKNDNQDLTYLQKQDNIIKIQVKYKNKDLVLQFITVDLITEDSKNDPIVLIIVQDMWQDLYQKKVQDLQKDKMRIFASLSHELRTPLNCSISMLEVLRDEISMINPSYIEEYLNPALFSNKLLLNQINDILDFVQMDSGKFKYSFFDFNIANLLQDCAKLVSMQAQMKQLDIQVDIDDDVPEIFRSDPNRIRQIILNFLSNSLKFTKQGYIQIGINKVNNDIYKLYVKDTGIGITEENLKTIFSFCAKVKYEKQDENLNAQGCGLGLTISNSIAKGLVNIENAEGGITVESVYGNGSTFSILLQNTNPNKEDGLKDYKSQMSKSQSIKKKQHRHMSVRVVGEEEKNPYRIAMNESLNTVANKLKLSNVLSPTIQAKQKLKNLINPQQIIFDDNQSFVESQNTSLDTIKYLMNCKKSQFNQNLVDGQEKDKSNISEIFINQYFAQENKKFDSAMVIEDENDGSKKIYLQPMLNIQHHFNRFQEEEECFSAGIKRPINSITQISNRSYSKQQQQQQEFQSQFSCEQKQKSYVKSESFYSHITQNNPSFNKFFDNSVHQQSIMYLQQQQQQFQEDPTIYSNASLETKKRPNNNVLNNSPNNPRKLKSLCSIQTQFTDFDKQKFYYQDQEGFTSYIGFNKIIESANSNSSHSDDIESISGLNLKQNSKPQIKNPSQTFVGQLINQDYFQSEEKIGQKKDKEKQHINQNPQDILNEIIQNNNNQKLQCKCPQIFIVDDNQFNLYALSKTIQQYQFSFHSISDSLQVLDDLKQMYQTKCCKTPKMIFMDIEMPEKNGYQVTQEINQFYNSIQLQTTPIIVACTAYVGQEDKDKALNVGMNDFINKPILKSAFQQLILNWADLFL